MTTTSYEQGEVLDTPMLCNAWLSPAGRMHFVRAIADHDYVAEIITDGADAWGDRLINDGWLRLSFGMREYVRSFVGVADAIRNGARPETMLTQAQRDTLWEVFISAQEKFATAKTRAILSELATILGVQE